MDCVQNVNKMKKVSDKSLYKKIVSLKSLKPSKSVNQAFSNLVSYALNPQNDLSLNQKQISKLQMICSEAEYELEKYWVNKILKSKDPKKTLEDFPYINNYRKLTQMEWDTLLSCTTHTSHKILFAGGGPLPLTAIILAQHYVDKVTVIDVDKEACDLAIQLTNKLGLDKKIEFIHTDASNFGHYSDFNVILVAALAGVESKTKEKILKKIKINSKPQTHILARSSWGLREILYRPIEKDLYKLFNPIVEVHPQNDVVNSVVVFSNK